MGLGVVLVAIAAAVVAYAVCGFFLATAVFLHDGADATPKWSPLDWLKVAVGAPAYLFVLIVLGAFRRPGEPS